MNSGFRQFFSEAKTFFSKIQKKNTMKLKETFKETLNKETFIETFRQETCKEKKIQQFAVLCVLGQF